MKAETFFDLLNYEFYVGVPDSQLKALCDFLLQKYGLDGKHHIIAANEGNAVGMAAGYYLSTGKIPVVYMQNSGEGNAINPIASLLNEKVYGIPCVFVIGWRGQPGIKDEPQHAFQGEITTALLDVLNIDYMIINENTKEKEILDRKAFFDNLLSEGKQVCYVIGKNGLTNDSSCEYNNDNELYREEVIEHIVNTCEDGYVISTTGKTSRELYEIREKNNMNHNHDFLVVGSMGHASSIALGIAMQKPDKKIWIIDGDGSSLMHMGSMPVIGAYQPNNIIHIIINNGSHESVGGQPTVMEKVDFIKMGKAFGYKDVYSISNMTELDEVLNKVKNKAKLTMIEVKTKIYSRKDLGRPKSTPIDNKMIFVDSIRQ